MHGWIFHIFSKPRDEKQITTCEIKELPALGLVMFAQDLTDLGYLLVENRTVEQQPCLPPPYSNCGRNGIDAPDQMLLKQEEKCQRKGNAELRAKISEEQPAFTPFENSLPK